MADVRSTEPNESGLRKARFYDGWRHAIEGREYEDALEDVTWMNLGWRFGKVIAETDYPDTSKELVGVLYDWAVDQMNEAREGSA